jgi:asparagine synthase (glutamine-hydrolysing)
LCGIAGFTTFDRPAPPGRIERLIETIVHRGPDQQAVYVSPHVALGAVRLSIIDVAGGDQPIRSEDGDAAIVFNGEIYNHRELRAELERRGRRFRTRCDTEAVLQAFLEWDTECFSRLRGMFAAAIWKESERRLVLVRDRMGIKPLYVYRRGGDLYFGSELKALFKHPEIDRELDPEALDAYLALNYVPGPRTLVRDIQKLSPGHWLEWKAGRTRQEPYWKLRMEPSRKGMALSTAKEELDSLLRESVREHLISDVPLGVWASGGIDSTTILHYAAGQVPRLSTFSVSFRGRSFDESPYFREAARAYGTDHHEFDLSPDQDLSAAAERIAWHGDEPSADAGALPVWFLSKMTRRHVTVALSGEGADELFGGYHTYLADRYSAWLRLAPRFLQKAALRAASLLPVSDEKIGFEYKVKRFLEGSLFDPVTAHFHWNGAFGEKERRRLCPGASGYRIEPLLPGGALESGPLNRYLWLDQLCYLPDDILYKCDRMSMAHSLEVRPPFLDHRIVEFAARLPESLKIRGSRLKFVLKELMKDKVPEVVLKRKKEGFDIPAHHWFRGPLKPLLLDTLTEDAVRASGVFSWPEVDRLLQRHFSRRTNAGYHLWGLMILFLWIRTWKIQAAPAAHSARRTLEMAGIRPGC